ncbi:MAG TPA: N-acetylmuramoyl-L-alanine amidase [Bacillota bacterium]|nr:N-acetylmuramoyl-L-alanine amidase [Bacillota bacterium]HNT04287.1 N-acetylmuramoyl-L-alanine amidase [Bacillota bacterium]HPX69983.1 N-acetylmuramoyl-L-alanine amidase [Bacillota bacterium]
MLFKVYDCEKELSYDTELDELTARITSFNTAEGHEVEYLKALAVMARTELARKTFIYNGKGCERHRGCDICTEPGHCLEYGLADTEIPKGVYDAVASTDRIIMLFEGRPIKPFFHYRCGGATENSENVLGNRITYLRRVLCSFCKDNTDNDSDRYFTVTELEGLLKTRLKKPEGIYCNIRGMFEDVEVDEQGKISRIKIGTKSFRGIEVRELLKLNSTRFDYIPVKFLIKCIGTGHGLGLCQCGANSMARSGMSYQEILKYYYTGIRFEQMEVPDSERPLKGVRIVLDAVHGGEDCDEGNANLDIVLKLKSLLEGQGAEVYLTRSSGEEMVLSDRAAISNDKRPDLFLSIGQNCFSNPTASGTEVYYYRGDSQGEKLSKLIMENVSGSLGLKNRGVRMADFYLLREIKASSVIIQLLYTSNPQDKELLCNQSFRESAAAAIFKGIGAYYENSRSGAAAH